MLLFWFRSVYIVTKNTRMHAVMEEPKQLLLVIVVVINCLKGKIKYKVLNTSQEVYLKVLQNFHSIKNKSQQTS